MKAWALSRTLYVRFSACKFSSLDTSANFRMKWLDKDHLRLTRAGAILEGRARNNSLVSGDRACAFMGCGDSNETILAPRDNGLKRLKQEDNHLPFFTPTMAKQKIYYYK